MYHIYIYIYMFLIYLLRQGNQKKNKQRVLLCTTYSGSTALMRNVVLFVLGGCPWDASTWMTSGRWLRRELWKNHFSLLLCLSVRQFPTCVNFCASTSIFSDWIAIVNSSREGHSVLFSFGKDSGCFSVLLWVFVLGQRIAESGITIPFCLNAIFPRSSPVFVVFLASHILIRLWAGAFWWVFVSAVMPRLYCWSLYALPVTVGNHLFLLF